MGLDVDGCGWWGLLEVAAEAELSSVMLVAVASRASKRFFLDKSFRKRMTFCSSVRTASGNKVVKISNLRKSIHWGGIAQWLAFCASGPSCPGFES